MQIPERCILLLTGTYPIGYQPYYVMKKIKGTGNNNNVDFATRAVITVLVFALLFPFNIFSATSPLSVPDAPGNTVPAAGPGTLLPAVATDSVEVLSRIAAEGLDAFPDSMYLSVPENTPAEVAGDSIRMDGDSIITTAVGAVPVDTVVTEYSDTIGVTPGYDPDYVVRDFNPDPTRAVWMGALFPGLGQLYNRRYWKLPIVIGAFMGLAYATDWNNRMLDDYTQAYRDLMDNDPSTDSYMDFYPPNTKEESLNRTWLEKTFKSKKDFYRRNRDLCIICIIGVYLIAIVDSYVDASLAHFDISPDLTMEVHPTVLKDSRSTTPGIGLQWALNF